jgi:hypothetical protein
VASSASWPEQVDVDVDDNDKGGAHVHGAVKDHDHVKVKVNVHVKVYVLFYRYGVRAEELRILAPRIRLGSTFRGSRT